jgi:hypothetical protein
MIETGRMARSSLEIARTLLEKLPGNGAAAGEVRMCMKAHHGAVTTKVMFWIKKPNVPTLYISATNDNSLNRELTS